MIGIQTGQTLNITKDLLIETAIGTVSFLVIAVLLLGEYYMISFLLRK